MKEHLKSGEQEQNPLPQDEVHKELIDEICQMLKRLDDRQLGIVHRFVRKLAE